MQVKQLDHLNLSVSNFDETVDWYTRIFGFEKVEEGIQDGVKWGVIKGGDAMLCVYEHPELEKLDWKVHASAGHHYIAHFALRVTDRAAWEVIVAENNLELHYGGTIEYPHSVSWYVTDPTGHMIEVVKWHDETIRFD
ncbi:VOC family protein [Planctomycetota bacterium]|nr:VOC family protein [Planctomycetota bacterium]